MPEASTGTVTFLFTDIEGSTRMWEKCPEAMQEALARHDEILRDAIDDHDSYATLRRWEMPSAPRVGRENPAVWTGGTATRSHWLPPGSCLVRALPCCRPRLDRREAAGRRSRS